MTTAATPAAPTTLTRDFIVLLDREALAARAEGDDRIPIAISSEAGVFRYDWMTGERYLEVLDHNPASVDLSRAADGLPFLVDHSTRDMVGLVEDVSVDKDRRLRGFVRFSRSQRGQEIADDMLRGIRRSISVGYATGEQYDQTKDEKSGVITRRYRAWTPYEASSVPIPADPTVGVGRAASPPGPPAATPTVPAHAGAPTAAEAKEFRMENVSTAAAPAAPAGLTREAVILDQCEAAGLTVAEARAFIAENKTPKDVAHAIEAKRKVTVTPAPPAPVVPDYAEKGRRFNVARAIRAAASKNWKEAGYEREVSEAEAKRLGQSYSENTVFMPTVERLSEQELATRASLDVATATAAGNSVFTEYGGFIEMLRNRSVAMRAGATVLSGLQGNVSMVKQDGAATAYWIAETPGSDVTESNLTTALVTLSPKTLMARQSVSNQLLAQASVNVDAMIRADLAAVLALEIDRAALHGSGASNQPSGLYTLSNVNSVAFGGAAVAYTGLVGMLEAIAADNADVGDIAFVLTPETAGDAMRTARFSSTDTPLYTGTFSEGQLIGYRALVTNQLAKNLGAGTNEHGILAGVWSQLLIGEWGGMALTVDPYTLAAQDVVRLIVRSFVDINTRYPQSFAKGTGLIS